DGLLPELPWPEARLKEMSTPLDPRESPACGRLSRQQSLALAQFLHEHSPIGLTRSLALVVRVLLDDRKALNEALYLIEFSSPQMLGPEAALALSSWRVLYGPGLESRDRYRLIEALRRSPFSFEAAVHLALLGAEGAEMPPDAVASNEPDIA